MMLLVNQPQATTLPTTSSRVLLPTAIQYRGWSIQTKVINGQMWVRWQHSLDDCSRYGCLVMEAGFDATISHAQSLIDATIDLELQVQPTKVVQSAALSSESAIFLWN